MSEGAKAARHPKFGGLGGLREKMADNLKAAKVSLAAFEERQSQFGDLQLFCGFRGKAAKSAKICIWRPWVLPLRTFHRFCSILSWA
jgi:hypothetical protein